MSSSFQAFKILYPTRSQILDNDERQCPDIYNHFALHGRQLFVSRYRDGYYVLSSGYCPREVSERDPSAPYQEYVTLYKSSDFRLAHQKFIGYCRQLLIGEWSLFDPEDPNHVMS